MLRTMSLWGVVALVVMLSLPSGCSPEDGDTCIASANDERCEGNTRVWCRENVSNLSTWQRDGCTVCVERGGKAACVEEANACSPGAYKERCGQVFTDTKVIRCTKVFGEEAFPVAEVVGCSTDDGGRSSVTSCNADGSVTRTTCTDGNYCAYTDTKAAQSVPICLSSSTPCKPGSYSPSCFSSDGVTYQSDECKDVTGAGDFFPVAIPASDPATAAACKG